MQYEAIVTVLKEKKGAPTKIEVNGREYALITNTGKGRKHAGTTKRSTGDRSGNERD